MTWGKLDSDYSDKILAMIVSLRHLLGWMVVLSVLERVSSSKTWLSVSNWWLFTPNDLTVD
jgi:hypothetical protein